MSEIPVPELASMHIVTVPTRSIIPTVIGVGADRWEAASASGSCFAKVLGTSKAHTTRTSVELRRWALFATWRDRDFYESFIETSQLLRRWHSAGDVRTALLQPLSAKGSWGGSQLINADASQRPVGKQTAVLTRAWVKPRHWLTFSRSIEPVDTHLRTQQGCSFSMGMGEWPIGEQATFSIWDSPEALEAFAYKGGAHSEVVRRRYQEGWYGEEVFARFSVIESNI